MTNLVSYFDAVRTLPSGDCCRGSPLDGTCEDTCHNVLRVCLVDSQGHSSEVKCLSDYTTDEFVTTWPAGVKTYWGPQKHVFKSTETSLRFSGPIIVCDRRTYKRGEFDFTCAPVGWTGPVDQCVTCERISEDYSYCDVYLSASRRHVVDGSRVVERRRALVSSAFVCHVHDSVDRLEMESRLRGELLRKVRRLLHAQG